MNEELMVAVYKDMRIACAEQEMQALKAEGWKIVNTMKVNGERRYTMALVQTNQWGHPLYEINSIERFEHYLFPAPVAQSKIA